LKRYGVDLVGWRDAKRTVDVVCGVLVLAEEVEEERFISADTETMVRSLRLILRVFRG
jgi:hypothetical protein